MLEKSRKARSTEASAKCSLRQKK